MGSDEAMDTTNEDLEVEAPDVGEGDSEVAAPQRLDADVILDKLVPDSIDWRDTVRRHPMVSVMAVGLVGYVVGRAKGAAILAGATAGLSTAMMRQLGDVLDGELFDFE